MRKRLFFAGIISIVLCFLPLPAKAQVIHEVAQGDTLTKISRQYGLKVEDLAYLNVLKPNAGLVIGQALLIQGSVYIVQPGDSIWESSSSNH